MTRAGQVVQNIEKVGDGGSSLNLKELMGGSRLICLYLGQAVTRI